MTHILYAFFQIPNTDSNVTNPVLILLFIFTSGHASYGLRRLPNATKARRILCALVVGSDEENFCATVPKDGRSYSSILFSQTARVLRKINKPGDMIVAFGLLADKIKVRDALHGSVSSYTSILLIFG